MYRLGSSRFSNRHWWTLALASTALLASCDSPLASEIEEVTRLDINPSVLTIVVGGNATLNARVYGAGDELLPTAKVFWSTQDASVVTVTQDGIATAVAPGTTQIAASAGGLSRTIAVTVSQRPIALIRISPPAGTVAVGSTLTLTGEALDGTGELLPNRLFEWSSNAPEVATVNTTGVVTGVATGQATISATGEGKMGTALITVTPSAVASIGIVPNGGTVPAGGTIVFVATPRDATGQPLTGRTLEWRSSNDAVATVSGSGLLTAISPGAVRITVSAPGAGPGGTTPSASADVTVLIEPAARAVLVPSPASLQVGQNLPLTVNLFNAAGNPLSTAGRTVTFSSSNTAVATVNSSGTVAGVTVGIVTITATITTPAQPGVVEATAQITVSNQPVVSVVVTPSEATVHVGYSRLFTAVARNGAGQTLLGRPIIWTSSDLSVATVDQTGLVVGVSAGTVQIRASAEGIQGIATVTVDLVAVSSVTLSPPATTILPAQTAQLTATPRDSAGTPLVGAALGGRITTWTSLNASVATVSTAGLVTGVAQGSATVLATIGGTNGQATVTVNPLPAASQLAITTQPSSTAQNDIAFPIQPVVQLRDASGNNVATAGVVIQAVISPPGTGTLGGAATATTNASGTATFSNLKITGLTGARTLTFTSGTLTPTISGAVTVQAGNPAQLVIITQPPASAISGQVLSTAPVVQLRDISGNTVPQSGVQVNAAVTPGAGVTLGGGSAATTAAGSVTFSAITLTGPAGGYTLTFSSGSLTPATTSAITLGAGSGSRLSLNTQPSPTVPNGAPFPVQPVVQLRDASNNPVAQSGVVVSVAILTGGGALGGTTTAITNASGVATFSGLSITGTIGARTLLFGASGYTTVTSNAITVTAGPATALSITTQPSATAQSGQAFASQPVIQLRDQSGNAVSQSGVAVAAAVNGAGASLIGSASATTNASGAAAFSGLGLAGTVGSYSISFGVTGLTGVTSSSIALAPGAAAQLTIITQPGGASSGAVFTTQPLIQIRDAQGNAVSQAGTTITASIASGPGGATLLGGTATTSASGLATFSGLGVSGTVGTYTIRFAATGLPNVTSGNVVLGPGPAALLTIQTQPAGAVNGAVLGTQPVIQVRDAQNNAVGAGVTVTTSLNGAGATLSGSTSALTNASGLASFSGLGVNGTAGNYSLTFAAGLPNVTSVTFALSAGAATQLGIATPPSATVASGSALATPPAVQLRDVVGNAVSQAGVSVSVAISGTGASLTGTTIVATNASGIATFTGLGLTGTVNNYTLQFSSTGLTGTTSSAISLTAGPAAALVMATQPPATALSNNAFSTAPAVRLRDAAGNNVSQAGVSIFAAVTGGGASLIGTTAVATNGSGVSTFTGLGIDGGGTFTITFSAAGLTSVISSSVAVSETASKLGMVTQPAASAQSGQVFGTQPNVRLLSASDNPVSQAGVTVIVGIETGPGGAILLGTASAVTNASGVASFTNLGISGTVGSYTLSFSSTGLTGVSSSAINLTSGAAGTITATSNASGVAGFSGLTVSGVMGDVFTITFSATGLTSASTGSLTFGFFDIQTQPREVESLTQADETLLVDSAFGTKPVAVHTLGLRTFSRGSGRFAGWGAGHDELPVAFHSSR